MANSITGLYKAVVSFSTQNSSGIAPEEHDPRTVHHQRGWAIAMLPTVSGSNNDKGITSQIVDSFKKCLAAATAEGLIRFDNDEGNGQQASNTAPTNNQLHLVVDASSAFVDDSEKKSIHEFIQETFMGATTKKEALPGWTPVQSWQKELNRTLAVQGQSNDAIPPHTYAEAKKEIEGHLQDSGASVRVVAVPYSFLHPTLVRSTNLSMGLGGTSTDSENSVLEAPMIVTVDGLCKEVLYKVGVAPKYGA